MLSIHATHVHVTGPLTHAIGVAEGGLVEESPYLAAAVVREGRPGGRVARGVAHHQRGELPEIVELTVGRGDREAGRGPVFYRSKSQLSSCATRALGRSRTRRQGPRDRRDRDLVDVGRGVGRPESPRDEVRHGLLPIGLDGIGIDVGFGESLGSRSRSVRGRRRPLRSLHRFRRPCCCWRPSASRRGRPGYASPPWRSVRAPEVAAMSATVCTSVAVKARRARSTPTTVRAMKAAKATATNASTIPRSFRRWLCIVRFSLMRV